jgi:hypothetical protein
MMHHAWGCGPEVRQGIGNVGPSEVFIELRVAAAEVADVSNEHV